MAAGALKERVSFAVRNEQDDGFGNTVAGWIEQFQDAAEYVHLRGGESVIAARLENRHPQIVKVRASTATRRVTADWRVTDTRTRVEYAIRDVTASTDNKWIDLLCERGVLP
ncbi:head-tail adaptor protein [Rhizobium leguminosarum]|uniref:head-tail adaptor protein n=1 Tax=Rhizobium leguminosarum TaxID=384 RepID=UPI00103E5867|nr:head-tail adaptor protein [Rhizobium leguminosarum]MBY5503135.1 head-tail adaptor protein [Rhizobium leguminosarum]NKK31550.1 head-tail adaptor protein [Rhizobium leguminosarum bv. viciae]TBZ40308.1 head-tail adaptor protein [Rhizobium leguminosarum bv. viciae]